jgi:hypothetical protein
MRSQAVDHGERLRVPQWAGGDGLQSGRCGEGPYEPPSTPKLSLLLSRSSKERLSSGGSGIAMVVEVVEEKATL